MATATARAVIGSLVLLAGPAAADAAPDWCRPVAAPFGCKSVRVEASGAFFDAGGVAAELSGIKEDLRECGADVRGADPDLTVHLEASLDPPTTIESGIGDYFRAVHRTRYTIRRARSEDVLERASIVVDDAPTGIAEDEARARALAHARARVPRTLARRLRDDLGQVLRQRRHGAAVRAVPGAAKLRLEAPAAGGKVALPHTWRCLPADVEISATVELDGYLSQPVSLRAVASGADEVISLARSPAPAPEADAGADPPPDTAPTGGVWTFLRVHWTMLTGLGTLVASAFLTAVRAREHRPELRLLDGSMSDAGRGSLEAKLTVSNRRKAGALAHSIQVELRPGEEGARRGPPIARARVPDLGAEEEASTVLKIPAEEWSRHTVYRATIRCRYWLLLRTRSVSTIRLAAGADADTGSPATGRPLDAGAAE